MVLASRVVKDLTPGSTRFMGLMELGGGFDIAPDGAELAFSANATEPPYAKLNYDVFTVKDNEQIFLAAVSDAQSPARV